MSKINNYLNILPGQSIEVTGEIDNADLTEKPALKVTAYNLKEVLRLVIL
jgi:hypothetical protein